MALLLILKLTTSFPEKSVTIDFHVVKLKPLKKRNSGNCSISFITKSFVLLTL